MCNEFEPWVETGETELAFYKRMYLVESALAERLEQQVEDAEDDVDLWYMLSGHWAQERDLLKKMLGEKAEKALEKMRERRQRMGYIPSD